MTITKLTADSTGSAVLMLGWRYSFKSHPKCPTHVVTSKPCQSAHTRKLVNMRNATAMTHPSRVPKAELAKIRRYHASLRAIIVL